MTRMKIFLILALVSCLTATFALPDPAGVALAGWTQEKIDPPTWGSATGEFWLELRLDQVRQQLLVEIGQCPANTLVFLEVQTTFYDRNGSQGTYQHFHPVMVDASGHAAAAVALYGGEDVVDYKLTAYALHADGTVESSEGWSLLARPVTGAVDIEVNYPGLFEALTIEMQESQQALSFDSPMGQSFAWEGFTQAFVPINPQNSSYFSVSGPGTVYTALPMSSMRLSAGPAGVFTAN
ncbi:MAG: hypothetical protein H6807_14245 [Planctomycetes bacterium]|nr:hypothetical protein [Planctomycetota bacterium]